MKPDQPSADGAATAGIHQHHTGAHNPPLADEHIPARSWYALLILTLIYSIHFLDRTMISIIVEPVRKEFLLSDSQIGLLTGLAYGATFALAGIPLGMMIDRVHRVRLLASIVAIWSAMTALSGIASSYVQLLLARIGVGAAEAGGSPASLSLISDLFPQRRRSTAVGIFFLSTGLGAVMSVAIGGYVTAHYGWRASMLIAGIPGLLLALVLVVTVAEPRRGATEAQPPAPEKAPGARDAVRYIWNTSPVLHLMMAMALTAGGVAAMNTWMPSFLMRFHGMNVKEAGMSLALAGGIFSSLGSFIGGFLCDRVARVQARRRMDLGVAVCALATVAAVAGLAISSNWSAVGLMALSNMLSFVVFPAVYGSVLGIVITTMRGTTSAAMQVLSNLVGYGMGPLLVGMLSDVYGGEQSLRYAMITIMCVCYPWAALHLWRAARISAGKSAQRGLNN